MFIAAALAGAILAPAAACADALQDRVLAAARATPAEHHAFRRTIVIERTGSDRKTIVEQFDPRRAPADRWGLVSIDGRAPTAKELAQARKAKRGPTPSYANLAKWFGGPAVRSDPAPGQALYRFARLPAGTLKVGSRDLSADTQAEALVDSDASVPFVARVRLTSTKGFRMMLVASMKSMTVASRYRPLADGTVVPTDSTSDIAGSLMGKAGALKTVVTYSDYRAVR